MTLMLYKLITGELLIAPEANVHGLTATEFVNLKLPMKILAENGTFMLIPWINGVIDTKVRTTAIIATSEVPDFLDNQYNRILAGAKLNQTITH